MSDTLRVKVWRGRGGNGAPAGAFATYDVPRTPSQTVLDVVTHIQKKLDPTLSYRFACRVGMCGSCAMTVNGKARWTCRTHVATVAQGRDRDTLEIAPLANLPVIKDLVTDMREFFDKWARAKGQFRGETTRHDDFARVQPQSAARQAANAGIECIGCGVCYASCDVVTWRPAFLGPAALNRAWTLVNDVRDVQQRARLQAVAGDAGCHACHTQGSCTERCPKKLEPTAGIAGLKRLAARAAMRGEL
jgi:fumarate reductase iron-sulfur subunit